MTQGHSRTVGSQALLELFGVPLERLEDMDLVLYALTSGAEAAGATILDVASHKFEPQGLTAMLLLSESHISIHTWPETNYAAVDIFTCGAIDPVAAADAIADILQPEDSWVATLSRPVPPPEAGLTES